MHNLHIVRVNEESGDQAVGVVEDLLNETQSDRFDFYNIVSAFDESGNMVYKNEDGRFQHLSSLSEIERAINEKYRQGEIDYNKNKNLLDEAVKKSDWYTVSDIAMLLGNHKELAEQIDNGKFDPFKVVFNHCLWDKFGITDIGQYASDFDTAFLVLVDFHS